MADAPEEGVIREPLRVEIRREYQHHIEGHREALAGDEAEIIEPGLERHDPAVEEIYGGRTLASQIVDDIHPVRGLDLQRCLVLARDRVIAHLQHVHGQLAARDDGGALAQHEARVEASRDLVGVPVLLRQGPVDDGSKTRTSVSPTAMAWG